MTDRISRLVIMGACVLTFALSAAAQNPQPQSPASGGPGDVQAKQELSDKFKANVRTDHPAAYAAAKDYLRRFPEDDDENAQFIKRWVAAYEKLAVKEKEAAPATGAPKAADATPSFIETVTWLQEKLNTYGSGKLRILKDSKPIMKAEDDKQTISNKIVDLGNCTVTVEAVYEMTATKKFAAAKYSNSYRIPVSSADPDRIDAWTTNEEPIPINSDRKPLVLDPNGDKHPEILINSTTSSSVSTIPKWSKELLRQSYLFRSSGIRLHIKGDAKLIDVARRTRVNDEVKTESFAVGSIQLFFFDQEIAKRAAVALSNAIKVCQEADKKSPF